MNDLIDDLSEQVNEVLEIDQFTSDDGEHEVKWATWRDEYTGDQVWTWVCTTHNKLYYADCVNFAQI
jgi:hypothetical protein